MAHNRAAFFATLRRCASGVFGTSLSQAQVEGTEAILDSCQRNGVTNPHHVANILAQVYHETAGYMLGIKETVYPSHKNKNPLDATVMVRLERAWARGQLPWVKTPYWRDGYFGRGPIMTTHRSGYQRVGDRLGVDLVTDPNRILDRDIGADSAVIGMCEGIYTGKKLGDYDFPAALDASPDQNPRRIVNGVDGTDAKIAKYHRAFMAAIEAAGGLSGLYDTPVKPTVPPEAQDEAARPLPAPEAQEPKSSKGILAAAVIAILGAIGAALATCTGD